MSELIKKIPVPRDEPDSDSENASNARKRPPPSELGALKKRTKPAMDDAEKETAAQDPIDRELAEAVEQRAFAKRRPRRTKILSKKMMDALRDSPRKRGSARDNAKDSGEADQRSNTPDLFFNRAKNTRLQRAPVWIAALLQRVLQAEDLAMVAVLCSPHLTEEELPRYLLEEKPELVKRILKGEDPSGAPAPDAPCEAQEEHSPGQSVDENVQVSPPTLLQSEERVHFPSVVTSSDELIPLEGLPEPSLDDENCPVTDASQLAWRGDHLLRDWRDRLDVGSSGNVWHKKDGKMYEFKIVPVGSDDSAKSKKGKRRSKAKSFTKELLQVGEGAVRVHFIGWAAKYDEIRRKADETLFPFGSFVRIRKPNKAPSKAEKAKEEQQKLQEYWAKSEEVSPMFKSVSDDVATKEETAGDEDGDESNAGGSSRRQRKTRFKPLVPAPRVSKKVERAEEDKNDWICTTCNLLDRQDEQGQDSPLLCCDGPCLRSWHMTCYDLPRDPNADPWLCGDCESGRHECHICHEVGSVDDSENPVIECSHNRCGKFYHASCVLQCERTTVLNKRNVDSSDRLKFLCPRHLCDTCGEGADGVRGCLIFCFFCHEAYHVKCIPPGVQYNEFCVICPKHPDKELPPVRKEDSFFFTGKGVDTPVPEARVGINASIFSKWLERPCRRGYANGLEAVNSSNVVGLSGSLVEEVYQHPPHYGKISSLRYIVKPPRLEGDASHCSCAKLSPEGLSKVAGAGWALPVSCGPACLNRQLFIECAGNRTQRGRISDKEQMYSNCNVGEGCGNRAFATKSFVKNQVFREGDCGWGLRTLEVVPAGTLVMEYLGEVIDDEILRQRFAEHHRLRPHDKNMYVMELASGYYVDARERGSVSRFINHSCDPNCELQRWNVNGHIRIGIFALRDIVKGEALSYDYAFFTSDESKFECKCGSRNCRGTLAKKSRASLDDLKHTKAIEVRKARKWHERRIEAESQEAVDLQHRLNLTTDLLPGTQACSGEFVHDGPKLMGKGAARRVFLRRNLARASEWIQRWELLQGSVILKEASASS